MSALSTLRNWANRRGVAIETSERDGKWIMEVSLNGPVKFDGSSGWQPSPEEAAQKLTAQLELIGEKIAKE